MRLPVALISMFSISAAALAAAAPSVIPAAPPIASKSYILVDAGSTRVLAERDGDEPLPPASLTKIMTSFVAAAEVAAGRIGLADEVPISVKAWRTGGSKMFIREGTKVRLEDLLRGIVIQSGNDASVAVAEYIGGDEDAFADMMNFHAKELGMTASRFVNSTGLPDDGHYTSARDLALLTTALIQLFPDHYRMYAEKSFKYGDIEQPNRNRLLWRDQSVDGVKTGLTEAAGYCLVASALRDGTRLIAVTMGADTNEARFQDAQKLLAYGFRYFESQQLFDTGATLADAEVRYGVADTVAVGVRAPVHITVPRGRYDELDAVMDLPGDLEAPIEAGAEVGVVRVTLDDEVLAEEPLVAHVAVAEAGALAQFGEAIYYFFHDLLDPPADDAKSAED